MNEYVTLLGAEAVQNAARNMQGSVEEFGRAVLNLQGIADQVCRSFDEMASRIEAAAERIERATQQGASGT